MTRAQVLRRLRASEAEFRAVGLVSLYLFGSVARGSTHDRSDVDLMLELPERSRFSLLDLVDFRDRARDLLDADVDVVVSDPRNADFRERISPDLVRVF